MKASMFIGVATLALGCGVAVADNTTAMSPQDTADIQHLMDTYHRAVVAHDGQAVSSLFLDHDGALVSVLSDKAYATLKSKAPSTQKIRVSSDRDYAKFVSNTASALDPRHADVRIMSDGAVASVYFHFDYMVDGKVQNRGDETWQLAKTTDGWRIVAITYSSNPGGA